jgi:hypothetical protein
MALVGAGLVGLVLAGYATGTAWAQFKRARQQLAAVREQTQAAQVRLKSLEARAAPTAALAQQALLSADVPPPRVLTDLAALMPADVKLDSVALSYAEAIEVRMEVSARSTGAYETFLQRLESSPLFEEPIPGDESRDGGVHASIQVRHRGVPR